MTFLFEGMALSLQVAETQEELDFANRLDDSIELGHKLRTDLRDEQEGQFETLDVLFGEARGEA